MTTQPHLLASSPAFKSGKRPPPLNQDDLEPLLSASLKVHFSPSMRVSYPRTPPPFVTQTPKSSAGRKSRGGDTDVIQYALETTKLPADVPTATFDGPMPSKFSSTESSSSSDSDDSLSEVKPRQRSVRFSLPMPRSPIPRARTQEEIDRALSFLPYSGSPYMRSPKMRVPRIKTSNAEEKHPVGDTLDVPPADGRKHAAMPPKAKTVRRPVKILVLEPSDSDVPSFAPPGLIGRKILTPVEESPQSTPNINVEFASSDENTDSTTSTLNRAFWGSVSVQHSPSDEDSDSPSPQSMPTDAFQASLKQLSPTVPKPALLSPANMPSAYPLFLYGKDTGTFWSPNGPRARARVVSPLDFDQFPFSPGTTTAAVQVFDKMTSPAPAEPVFPSLTTAVKIIEADGAIAFPPRAELKALPSPRVVKL